MAIVDVVKCTMNTRELVKKFPSDDLRLGTQLVVYPSQVAFFVKGGQILDEFESGTYTLKTSNIPMLNKLINLPFGGSSPFKAEVWYVNLIAILDSKWGTATPLQIEDPKYEVIVPVRAYGQYGFKISDARLFLETLVGNMQFMGVDKINDYFKARIMSRLTNIVSDKLTKDNISILNIGSHLQEISSYCKLCIADSFEKYGLSVQEFDVISISAKEDDPSFIQLKRAKESAARMKIMGKDVYQMERSFDVLDSAAANRGIAGTMIGAGVGLGMGAGIGGQMSQMSQMINTNPAPGTPPPLPVNELYYVAVNGVSQGPYPQQEILSMIQNKFIDNNTLCWKQGMANWSPLSGLAEFARFFMTPPQMPNR